MARTIDCDAKSEAEKLLEGFIPTEEITRMAKEEPESLSLLMKEKHLEL
jgi:hypothetical protein